MNADIEQILNSISYIKPEIAISIALLFIVLFDLIFSRSKKYLPYISFIALVVTLFLVITDIDLEGSVFALQTDSIQNLSMITIDSFGIFFPLSSRNAAR